MAKTALGATTLASVLVVSLAWPRLLPATSPVFCAAYFETAGPGVLKLFPVSGSEMLVPFSDKLPRDFYPITVGPNGRVLYGESLTPGSGKGIWAVQLRPLLVRVVPGSIGLSEIWHLAVSEETRRLFVAGPSKYTRMGDCGTFEIDPTEGGFRVLLSGKFPGCGGGGGPISPEGKRALTFAGGKLEVIALETGAVHVIDGLGAGVISGGITWVSGCDWSPDGRWIACVRNGNIILVNSDNSRERKDLGRSGSLQPRWSPDSRTILISKPEVGCGLGYGGSLELIEVYTGKRTRVTSSRCRVGSGMLAWVDTDSVPSKP